ncbi:carotenoid 1,2-hydratase [Ramlibacter sp. PS4R-6]|uniref:lipocalin-like domain-containing protein n=1 Tax=Ramlibacter sp. PS4R-6 TaxID=3133438 RepID=UPI0030AD217A
MARRELLRALAASAFVGDVRALPPARIEFPRDHGAHPPLRTEWWYVTGRLTAGAREFGFQVTFFRSRVDTAQALQSRFAAKQLVFAHAALTDVDGKRLWHDQRIAREGSGIAQAPIGGMQLKLHDWSLARDGSGAMQARITANGFALDLRLQPTQAPLLQGDAGLSRKGPLPAQASYYYSEPQLEARGAVTLQGKRIDVAGRAWLDHEWSEEVLDPSAVGWDWIGMNLDDGGALTAFRLRKPDGSTLWDGGSFRPRGGSPYVFSRGEAVFSAQRRWTSPLSQASYPVEWIVRTPADFYTVTAALDGQELDSRASTGAIYWEGLARLRDSNGRAVGHGYLEMTGYAQRLRI